MYLNRFLLIVSTRPNTSFQIADDAVRIIYEHLGKAKKVDLILHSFGGVGTTPWKLVNLIREYVEEFDVIVPYKAYSAATMIALGADNIVMHPMAELGPIDPKAMNEFNPLDARNQQIGINVEDVASYVNFVKEFVGIRHKDELVQALNVLTEKVHPLALGNVHRFYAQSRMIARKLLGLHMDSKQTHIIDEITETLTAKLFFHGHPINRKEAMELKLKIIKPDNILEGRIWDLYLEFEKLLEMDKVYDAGQILTESGKETVNYNLKGACIESCGRRDVFEQNLKIMKPVVPTNAPMEMQLQALGNAIEMPLSQKWQTVEF